MSKSRIALTLSAVALTAGGLSACGTSATASSAGATATSGTMPSQGSATPPAGAPAGAPGGLTEATGSGAEKAKAAALAKYPGEAEKVLKTATGYVVHVITSSGEQHVAVSSAFRVTGLEQGPGGGTPPSGTTPSSGTTTGPST